MLSGALSVNSTFLSYNIVLSLEFVFDTGCALSCGKL